MQITNTVAMAFTLLASTVFAEETTMNNNDARAMDMGGLSVTVQLANEVSGANSDISVPVDGVPRPVQELWGSTPVSNWGIVEGTSAQLTGFEQEITCTFYGEPGIDTTLNSQQTWASFGEGKVTDLCATFLVCECVEEGY